MNKILSILIIASTLILTGFKKNNRANKLTAATSPEISIADVKVVEGNAGQKKVQVNGKIIAGPGLLLF